MSNPYTLVFGQPPIENIERTAQAERIISEFCQDRPSNYINLITGIRGCGKTVFITEIAERLKTKKEWIVINLNPQRDLLTSFAAKLESNSALRRIFKEAEINLQAFGIGAGIKSGYPINDIEEALTQMLQRISKHGKRVLVTIDEASNTKDMRIFASSYQIFIRERLPVFLLMTGLFKNIDRLRNADGMTFLERAPRTILSPLDTDAITYKYKETLGIAEDKAIRLAEATKGYSFAFQTIGYFTWENPNDPEKAENDAKDYLIEFAYNKIWSELSAKDREVVCAIAKVPSGEILHIRKLLDYSSNQFNPYRDRLIKAGVIIGRESGQVEFALPWFDEFSLKHT
ncbi:MAG: AAA family ATPase [Lachnospiraceae bacterium]|nr:AAA family ATPase [Lachnospiraceae bacterium]